VLKAGNSATVIRAEVGARRCVVKRYNVKGPWHALRRSLRIIPRFRRSWLNGQRLHLLAIPTARPLALVERRWGPGRGVAYLVMEDLSDPGVGGPRDLAEEVRSGVAAERVDQVVALFQALQVGELSHGDTKATNFLVDAHDRLCLIDLDAMRSGRRALAGDVARFLDNFAGRPALRRRYAEALRAAGLPGTE
jgi:Ser/Thr protein kinase RdoA (MazF antagonist)